VLHRVSGAETSLEGRGGIVLTAQALGGARILFVRDVAVPVPEKYRALVRFTRAELEQIVAEKWSVELLAAVVAAKEATGGGIIVPDEPVAPAGVEARTWLATAPAAAVSVSPTLEDLCEERQGWLVSFGAEGQRSRD
jgi:hypothetical protein